MKNKVVQQMSSKLAAAAKEANDYIAERLNSAPDPEKAAPEQSERVRDAVAYLEAWRARFSVVQDLMAGRAFVVYQEGKELVVVRPETEQSAKLIAKAEELGARIVKLGEFGKEEA